MHDDGGLVVVKVGTASPPARLPRATSSCRCTISCCPACLRPAPLNAPMRLLRPAARSTAGLRQERPSLCGRCAPLCCCSGGCCGGGGCAPLQGEPAGRACPPGGPAPPPRLACAAHLRRRPRRAAGAAVPARQPGAAHLHAALPHAHRKGVVAAATAVAVGVCGAGPVGAGAGAGARKAWGVERSVG